MSTVANPILPGCYPDPSICRVDDVYYLVSSTFEYFPGLPIHRSRDLVSWEPVGHGIHRPGQLDLTGVGASRGLFAPTLRHHDGTFWLICTLVGSRQGSPGGHFYVTATDPAGPWSDPVWLDGEGIDPSLLFDDDGRVWVHATRPARDPAWHDQTEVWLRELDPRTGTLVGDEHVLWHGALENAVWAEGPHLFTVDGRYYLLAAEGGTDYHHAVVVARADAVTGPYVGSPANPVLTHRHLGRGTDVVGVGHADLVQAVDGSWWAVALGMRPYGGYHYNLGRETFLVPVTWEDGWPVLAPGEGRVPTRVEVPFAGEPRPGLTQGTTSGPVGPDDVRWTSLRGPLTGLTTTPDEWHLGLSPMTLTEPGTPAFRGVRQQHTDVDLRVHLTVPLADGTDEEAGLVIRQSEDDHVRLCVTSPTDRDGTRDVTVVHRHQGTDHVQGQVTLTARPHDPLVLTISARGQDYTLTAATDGGHEHVVATVDGRTLDSVTAGGFLGLWWGVYGTSNGRPTTTSLTVHNTEYLLP
ncbi:glycoside hydrolase family 43 protein [Cellulomonas bogoriensis]|uniref:Alpha-N-arabinofuranosidase n=1 Tax=Cellulomonas bogoriensis 69B4 = DSM 16987 TaxID=1386082 RepID=A0A0A0BU61_9CELL|nr:glycoside hydrolase family 43 protein [Cellulomonas bogoriensis]KGM11466.1 alpha-N-arabinofuranosidase [Cellulomonas bogoriensis 69B4 = DSM 16987]